MSTYHFTINIEQGEQDNYLLRDQIITLMLVSIGHHSLTFYLICTQMY